MNFKYSLIAVCVLWLLSGCGKENTPLVEVGTVSRNHYQCEAAQELPHECDTTADALRSSKLAALAAGHSEADIDAAVRIATGELSGSPEQSPYIRVRHAFAKAQIPVAPMDKSFKVFSRKYSCADVGDDLLLVGTRVRDDFYYQQLTGRSAAPVFLFEHISKRSIGSMNRQPCLSLDNFPEGTFVLSAEQFETLRSAPDDSLESPRFELAGEHEEEVLREGQRESRIEAEMSRLEALHPDKYRCKPKPGRILCWDKADQLRQDAMLNLGFTTQAEIEAQRERPPSWLGMARYNGDWCWNVDQGRGHDNSLNSMYLSLTGRVGGISGRHCIREPNGRNVDCVNLSESAPTVDGVWIKDAFVVKVLSAASDQIGEATIRAETGSSGFTLRWTQTKPAGPYFPKGAIELVQCPSVWN